MSKIENYILVGAITGVHGLKGLVKVKSYTEDPMSLFSYGELYKENGEECPALTLHGFGKDFFLVEVDGVSSRTLAEPLRGLKLYIPKTALPEAEEDSFYHTDLLGLSVKDSEGKVYGKVVAVHNFGAGDILEIDTGEKRVMLPFTKEVVPFVNIEKGELIVANDEWFRVMTDNKNTSHKSHVKAKEESNV